MAMCAAKKLEQAGVVWNMPGGREEGWKKHLRLEGWEAPPRGG